MKISQIKAGMRNIEVIGRLVELGKPVQMSTRYGLEPLAKAKLRDDTGEIVLNLWRQQIDVAQEGEIVILRNAFAREFSGVVQLNIGADGEILRYSK
ncbi:MAG: DNA-binding protein [Candidatus Aminicenantes bacterium]|nr:DNA-binding protein [Candidatus Aminicenantes bacterium]